MTSNSYQSGGKDKHWLFDPQQSEHILPIISKLVVHDKYFDEEEGENTLAIVLDKILNDLPAELEEAVRLVYLSGISYRSAAKIMQCDHKTVKARAERGVAKLRERLTDTVWLATMVAGMVPDSEETPKVSSEDNLYTVLDKLSRRETNGN